MCISLLLINGFEDFQEAEYIPILREYIPFLREYIHISGWPLLTTKLYIVIYHFLPSPLIILFLTPHFSAFKTFLIFPIFHVNMYCALPRNATFLRIEGFFFPDDEWIPKA